MQTKKFTNRDLANFVLKGRLDFFQAISFQSPLKGAAFNQRSGRALYSFGVDYAPCNGVIEESDQNLTEKEIDFIVDFFATRKLPFMWWTDSKILEKKGFQYGGILTGIAMDISKTEILKPRTLPKLSIGAVESKEELEIFTDLSADASSMNEKAKKQWLELSLSTLEKKDQIHYLAKLEGVPVGTATLSILPSSTGIWNMGTLPHLRKQGIGSALVHAALMDAKKLKYNQVMAILMPKGLAWGLFAKFGFQAVKEFPFYVYGTSAETLEK